MKGEKAKKIAAEILNTSSKKIWVNPEESEALKDAITKDDIRALIKDGIIKKKKTPFQSRVRAREKKAKKEKGRRRGPGRKRGTKKNRIGKKKSWMKRVRSQRQALRELRKSDKKAVEKIGYRKVYSMIKGNYFKGKRYLVQFVKEGAGK
ncbi:MAG: 50S ribosomal protein L19e [Candidatus Diapherotrites archaeon]